MFGQFGFDDPRSLFENILGCGHCVNLLVNVVGLMLSIRWPVVKRQLGLVYSAGLAICGGTLLRMGFIFRAVWTVSPVMSQKRHFCLLGRGSTACDEVDWMSYFASILWLRGGRSS